MVQLIRSLHDDLRENRVIMNEQLQCLRGLSRDKDEVNSFFMTVQFFYCSKILKFFQDLIAEAETIGINLDVDFVVRGTNDNKRYDLMAVPFNPSNINLFGTKILNILFDDEDLGTGTIEPGRSNKPTLDLDKINLLKQL